MSPDSEVPASAVEPASTPGPPCLDPEWISIWEIDDIEGRQHPDVKAANSTEWANAVHEFTTDVRLGLHERIHPA